MNNGEFIFSQDKDVDIVKFETLYKQYYRTIYSYAAHFVNEHSVRMDIVQDVFGYVWENKETLQINKSIKSYLLTACHNTCLNYINKQKVRQKYVSKVLERDANYVDGYDAVYVEELKAKIEVVLEELPEQCRKIFELSRIKGMKHKEIAELLNISPKTVEVQVYRALKVFKLALKVGVLTFVYIFL